MAFIIGLLTVVLVLDCVVLMFLVLIQLPKKEAGAGLAFGGGATDALFGAGSGNVLTKITKYAAGTFFVLAILLGIMQRNYQPPHHERVREGGAEPPGRHRAAARRAPAPRRARPPHLPHQCPAEHPVRPKRRTFRRQPIAAARNSPRGT